MGQKQEGRGITPLSYQEQHTSPNDDYDLFTLGIQMGALGYAFRYEPETDSTMNIAAAVGTRKTLVIADDQTQGRGRYKRSWLSESKRSILGTFVEPFDDTKGDPGPFSGLSPHMFSLTVCLALQEETGNKDIKLRWPGDPVYNGKKLGGVLVENPDYTDQGEYPKLFGVGINVHYAHADTAFPETDYGAISLAEITKQKVSRQKLIVAIAKKWADMRVDLRVMQKNPKVFEHYNTLWRQNAELIGQHVSISGLPNNTTIEGTVLDSTIGNGIILQLSDGTRQEVNHYDTYTVINVRK